MLNCDQLFCNPMDYSPPGSSVHEISQSRILEWVFIYFSRGSSWSRGWTHCVSRQILYHWATWEAIIDTDFWKLVWQVLVVQALGRVWLFATLWSAAQQASLSFTISWSLLRLMSIEPVMPSNHLIVCHPLLLLPLIFPISGSFPVSQLFTSSGQTIGSFSFSVSLSTEYFKDWLVWSPCCPRDS